MEKKNKSQSMDFINFIESEENDKVITAKNWKNFIVNTNIYKYYTMIQENAFITPYKASFKYKK